MSVPLAATLGDLLGAEWELRPDGDAALASVSVDDDPVITVRVGLVCDELDAACAVGAWAGYSPDSAAWLINVLEQTALSVGACSVRLRTVDLVLRQAARLIGFEGALREDLVLDTATKRPRPFERPVQEALAAAIESLMPGSSVAVSSNPGRVRRVLERAVSGSGAQVRVDITDQVGRLSVRVPDRSDLIPEAIALAADTTLAVKLRFSNWIGPIDSLWFDLSHYGMSRHKVGGTYNQDLPQIHLSAVMCCAELAAAAVRACDRRRPPRRPSASIAGVYRIDHVTAHELGHQLDHAFQSRSYKDSIEFRRRLGEILGVATLETALRGGAKKAAPKDAIAWKRLAEDVSPYATTSTGEAMAELFAVWWSNQNQSPEIIACFGDLLAHYLPTRPG